MPRRVRAARPTGAARDGRRCSARGPPRCTPRISPTRTSAARRRHRSVVPVPDHRARPRRRHRAGARRWPTPGRRSRLGSDSHAVIDLFEEARGGRDATSGCATGRARPLRRRPSCSTAATRHGHASLGLARPAHRGRAPGRPGDGRALDSVARPAPTTRQRRRSSRATAADVVQVVVDGRSGGPRRRSTGSSRRRRRAPRRARSRAVLSMSLRSSPTSASSSPTTRAGDGPLGLLHDAALVLDDGLVAWVGPAADAPAADERVDAGGARRDPRLRRQPHPPGVRRRPRRPSSRPGWRASRTPRGGIRTTVAATRAADRRGAAPPTSRRLVAEMRRQGTTTVEIKSGYGLTVADEARSLAVAARVHRRDDVPRRPRRAAGVRRRPGRLRRRWSAARCSPPPRRTRAGSTSSARRGAFDADQARAVLAAGVAAGLRGRLHANQLGPGPASRSPSRSGGRGRPLHVPRPTPTSMRSPDSGTVATLLPGRRVLDPAALSRCPPAARRRRHRRAGHRLQPRLVLHDVDAVLHRAGRPRDGDDARGGACRRDRRRRGRARPRGRRRAGAWARGRTS